MSLLGQSLISTYQGGQLLAKPKYIHTYERVRVCSTLNTAKATITTRTTKATATTTTDDRQNKRS